jgi:membrane associated rhomboid family serine protease
LVVGPSLERRLGPAKFLALYFLCGQLGGLLSVAVQHAAWSTGAPQPFLRLISVESVGATAPVCGLFAAYFAFARETTHYSTAGIFLVLCMYCSFHAGIDGVANAGGFVTGLIGAWALNRVNSMAILTVTAVGLAWSAVRVTFPADWLLYPSQRLDGHSLSH